MYCRKCGSVLPKGMICSKCGTDNFRSSITAGRTAEKNIEKAAKKTEEKAAEKIEERAAEKIEEKAAEQAAVRAAAEPAKTIEETNSNKPVSTWIWLAVVSFITSVFFGYKGWFHLTQYDSGDYYPYKMVNAYVGGDAYNYIINGTYATSYFVLCMLFVMLGIGLLILNYVSKR